MDSFQGRYFLIIGAKIGLRGCIPSSYTREKGVSNKYLAFLKIYGTVTSVMNNFIIP